MTTTSKRFGNPLFLLLLILLLPISYSSNIIETFPTQQNILSADLPIVDYSTFSSEVSYEGSSGFWYVGDGNDAELCGPSGQEYIYFQDYWTNDYDLDYQLRVNDTDCEGQEIMFWRNYDEFYFGPETTISFIGNVSSTDAGALHFYIMGLNESNHGFIISMGSAYGNEEYLINSSYTHFNCVINNTGIKSLSPMVISERMGDYANCNDIYGQNFKRIIFMIQNSFATPREVFVGGFNITNVNFSGNGQNQLPNVTVESEGYKCINNSESFPVTVDVNITALDNEGDTIYYGTSTQVTNTSLYYDFADSVCTFNPELYGVALVNPFYDVCYEVRGWKDIYYNFVLDNSTSEMCLIDTGGSTINRNYHQLGYYEDAYGDQNWQLFLNYDCIGNDKSVLFDTKTISYAGDIYFNINDFNNGEGMNLTVLDENFEDNYFHINIWKNGTQLYVESANKTVLWNKSVTTDSFGLFVSNSYSQQDNFYVRIDHGTNLVNSDSFYMNYQSADKDKFRYVKYGITSGQDLGIEFMLYNLQKQDISFSTVKPTSVTFTKPDLKHIFYYVSDSVHQPNEYVTKDIFIQVEQKSACFVYDPEFDNFIDDTGGLGLRSFIDGLSLRSSFSKASFLIFFILVGVFLFKNYMSTRNFELPLAVFVSSFLMFIPSYLIKDSLTIVSYLILFVLSLVGLVLGSKP